MTVGPDDGPIDALARRLAADGAAVVLVAGPDAPAVERAGRLAAEVEASGTGRPAVFVLDPTDPTDPTGPTGLDGLVAFVAELFGDR